MTQESIQKGTHNSSDLKIELFQTLMKDEEGNYIAVLSDTSMDRDGEMVGYEAFEKLRDDEDYLVALCDHKNEVSKITAEWTNRKIMEVDGHTALVSTPKFYQSTPAGREVKGLLDEGAKLGVSIGAIVKNYETKKIDGKDTCVYTELELVEASFVAIPSNRHGMAMAALAKSFKNKKHEEETQMAEKTYTQKEYEDLLAEKEAAEALVKEKQEELDELQKNADEDGADGSDDASDDSDESGEAEKSAVTELVKELKALRKDHTSTQKQLNDLLKSPVLKATHTTPEGNDDNQPNVQKGALPILRQ